MTAGTLVRKAVKAAALPVGIGRSAQSDTIVLLYHRIGPGRAEIDTPVDRFERQLSLLASTGRVRALPEVLQRAGGVVVTFDDGTPDFFDAALPALVRHRIPAALYVATAWIGGRGLSWDRLRKIAATGLIEIASHTHDHLELAHADERSALEQMRRSKEILENGLGRECAHLAYPFAVGSPAADRVARRLFRSAALGAWRTNRAPFDPYRIGRVPILRSDGDAFFRAKIRGRLDAEGLAYRIAGRGPWRIG